jgi:hypothetical protein
MTKFKRRRTKGRTTQWSNLSEEGQRDGQHNGSLCPSSFTFGHCVAHPFVLLRLNLTIVLSVPLSLGRTTQWSNLSEEGQRDGQHNGQI